jgi:alpha-beta hydrolase superfamily lysophospholipase
MHHLKRILFAALRYALVSVLTLVLVYVYVLESRPDLKVWHVPDLDAEFVADMAADIKSLDDYRRLEDRLFAQLEKRVYERIDPADRTDANRYHTGARMDPQRYSKNWNRSFELSHEQPVGGILLLHGLSDSPYSMRSLGQLLHEKGFWVVGLRLPGHGTAPSGLLDVRWQDWAEATRVAARHVRERIGSQRPLHLIGFSNGAAVAVEYAISALEGESLPKVQKMVLLSPAIGVSKAAVLAKWQARLSRVAGLKKVAWTSIEPEFDPYKYNSFTVNAGQQIYELTRQIGTRLPKLSTSEGVAGFPKLLAFQSAVDATVRPAALIDVLFGDLANDGHELVLFGVNRHAGLEALMKPGQEQRVRAAFDLIRRRFTITLIDNENPESERVVARTRQPGVKKDVVTPLNISWPPDVFSLSHVALPFPPDDPIYGATPDPDKTHPWITLGAISVHGERGKMLFPDSYFMRLRNNPFHAYMSQRIVRHLTDTP